MIGRCVEDGIAGARNDLSGSPNIDIANGAPSGAGAPNRIVDNYVTGPALNQEKVYLTWSVADELAGARSTGASARAGWSGPQQVSTGDDRGYYTAPALSPDGSALYVVYNAYTTQYQDTTFTPRGLVGVFRTADDGRGRPAAVGRRCTEARSVTRGRRRRTTCRPSSSATTSTPTRRTPTASASGTTSATGMLCDRDQRTGAWRSEPKRDAGDPPNPVPACPPRFGETDIWSFTTG